MYKKKITPARLTSEHPLRSVPFRSVPSAASHFPPSLPTHHDGIPTSVIVISDGGLGALPTPAHTHVQSYLKIF